MSGVERALRDLLAALDSMTTEGLPATLSPNVETARARALAALGGEPTDGTIAPERLERWLENPWVDVDSVASLAEAVRALLVQRDELQRDEAEVREWLEEHIAGEDDEPGQVPLIDLLERVWSWGDQGWWNAGKALEDQQAAEAERDGLLADAPAPVKHFRWRALAAEARADELQRERDGWLAAYGKCQLRAEEAVRVRDELQHALRERDEAILRIYRTQVYEEPGNPAKGLTVEFIAAINAAERLVDRAALSGAPSEPREEVTFWLIHFEDADRGIEVFTDEGAARRRSEEVGQSWTHTLFVEATALDRAR